MLFQIPQWAIRLTERIRGGSRWFARLMDGIPGDRKLVTPFEAIVETGTVWFRYNVYRSEEMGEAMLELSVDVPYPDGEEAVGAVDKAIETLVDGWWTDGLLDSCDWKEEKGPFGALLALEFQAVDVSAEILRSMQESLLAVFREHGCLDVTRYLRSSADFEIFYSEMTGNTIQRSVSMKSAFDIVRGRYRSAGSVTFQEDHETLSDREEFESLFDAGKDDIQMPDLTFEAVAGEIREIILGLPYGVRIKTLTEGRRKHIKAVLTGAQEQPVVYCLTWSDGRWWTYYEQNGMLTDVCAFESEPDACDYYLRFLEEDAYGDTPPPTYEEVDYEYGYSDDWYGD